MGYYFTYGNFAQAREGMKNAMYGAISFITYFVINNANETNEHNDYIYRFDSKDRVLIPSYNGIIGELENMRVYAVIVDDVTHDLCVECEDSSGEINVYNLNDVCTDIVVVGAIWNILEEFFQYYD